MPEPVGDQTLAVRMWSQGGDAAPLVPPIYQTATFVADSAEDFLRRASNPREAGYYTRVGNPTLDEASQLIADLEGAEAGLMFGSGMGAVSSVLLTFLSGGAHVVAQQQIYANAGTLMVDRLTRLGIEVTQVDQTDPEQFEAALRPETKLIYLETPTNPLLALTDLSAVAEIARRRGILTVVDNTVSTPINTRPIALGVDLVLHSATKYLGGHSDVSAGAVVGRAELMDQIWQTHYLLGAVLGPFDAWLVLRGIRTLPIRMARHNENGLRVARFLESHPLVSKVYYPGLESHPQRDLASRQMKGFNSLMSFVVAGGYETSAAVLAAVGHARHATSLGSAETLITQPAAMWATTISPEDLTARGIEPALIRMSVGLEDSEDLIADLEQALNKASGT